MHIFERTTSILFLRIILTDNVHIFIVDILLLVMIAISIIIRRRRINDTRRTLPILVSVGKTEKLIESLERAYTLYILQTKTIRFCRLGGKFDRTSQATTGFVYRGSTM